jgi:hypothetical protein
MDQQVEHAPAFIRRAAAIGPLFKGIPAAFVIQTIVRRS